MRLSQQLALSYIRTKFRLLSAISKRKAANEAFGLFCTPQYRNRKKLPAVFEKAEKLHFHFNGNRIQGYRWNHLSEKKFLILHGYESSVINFDRYVKPMVRCGYEVLAFDAPAHGRSGGKKINGVLYKEFIQQVVQRYGPVTNFIAHSLGGLALSLFLEEHSHDRNYKIALIAPATETTTAINSFFKFLRLDAEVRKEFDKLIEKMGGHPPEWFSVARIAAKMKASVLWLQDKDDEMTPLSDVLPVMEKEHPNIEFYLTEGLGHRRIYRDNKVTKKIISFMEAS